MTRGNQRDLARAKNLKKQQEQARSKPQPGGLTVTQRKERDAQVMRDKQQKKLDEQDKNKS